MKNIYERTNKKGEIKYCVLMLVNKKLKWFGSFDTITEALYIRDLARNACPPQTRRGLSACEKRERAEKRIAGIKQCVDKEVRVIWDILAQQPYPITANAIASRVGSDWVTDETVESWMRVWEREKRVQRHGENTQGQMLYSVVIGAVAPQ